MNSLDRHGTGARENPCSSPSHWGGSPSSEGRPGRSQGQPGHEPEGHQEGSGAPRGRDAATGLPFSFLARLGRRMSPKKRSPWYRNSAHARVWRRSSARFAGKRLRALGASVRRLAHCGGRAGTSRLADAGRDPGARVRRVGCRRAGTCLLRRAGDLPVGYSSVGFPGVGARELGDRAPGDGGARVRRRVRAGCELPRRQLCRQGRRPEEGAARVAERR